MNTTAIEVHDLHQKYGDFAAVKGIGFQVGRGELYALLGTNGAGKTTTLDVLEGYAAPTSGRVRVLGHDPIKERGEVRHRMGIVLQEAGFYKAAGGTLETSAGDGLFRLTACLPLALAPGDGRREAVPA